MLAYRHAFHAGNHADVLKHLVFTQVLKHMNQKDKGWRCIDTHAGAGGYSLQGEPAKKRHEFETGIGALWGRSDLPAPLAELVGMVKAFNGGDKLVQYPGSPALAQALMRPQDQLRLFELHPTDHKILASYLGETPGVEVKMADGFASLKPLLPPPTRRGVVLIDPPYELKTDYARVLAALREVLTRFADAVVVVWLPQVRLIEAATLPQRLRASAQNLGKKGWLQATLTVGHTDERGFGMFGSTVFVANPPHTLHAALKACLPWMAAELGEGGEGKFLLETSED